MNKNIKIFSSLALAGILSINSWGARTFAVNPAETNQKSEGVYRNVLRERLAVPFILSADEKITVNDLAKEFNLVSFNGNLINLPLDGNTLLKTGDKFVADTNDFTVIIYGDVTKDGIIDVDDAVKINEYAVGLTELDEEQRIAANIEYDEEIDVNDSVRINEFVVGISVSIKTLKDGELTPDVEAPSITNVPENGITNQAVTPEIDDNVAIQSIQLNGENYIVGTVIEEEGDYELVAKDYAGHTTTMNFTIDKTAPQVDGVTNNGKYKEAVIPTWEEEGITATLNGEAYEKGTAIEEDGEYTLVLIDKAGNETIVNFSIKTALPEIIGLENTMLVVVKGAEDAGLPEVSVSEGATLKVEGIEDIKLDTLGEYKVTYTATDDYGNMVEKVLTVVVDNGEKPALEVNYNNAILTNKPVKVTITANKPVQLPEGWAYAVNEAGEEIKTVIEKEFTENVEDTITVYDFINNETTASILIENIDTTVAAKVLYTDGDESEVEVLETVTKKNENVTVTIMAEEDIEIIEENSTWATVASKRKFTKVYTESGDETVLVRDALGNEKELKVKVSLDRKAPGAEYTFNITEPTKENVTVVITADEELDMTKVPAGWTVVKDENEEESKNQIQKEFTANTQVAETVVIYDLAGNSSTILVNVNNIDRDVPAGVVTYSTKNKTNQNVIVTITGTEKLKALEGWTLVEENKLQKEFEQNINTTVKVEDLAGNESASIPVVIANIDKVPAKVQSQTVSSEELTNSKTIYITFDEAMQEIEGWTLDANKVMYSKTYTKSGNYTASFKDEAGNVTELTFTISDVDSEAPVVSLSLTNEDGTTGLTNGKVIAKITADKEIVAPAGWTLSEDHKSISKAYSANTDEYVDVKDALGNTASVRVTVDNIDTVLPVVTEESRSHAEDGTFTNQDVIITLSANKEVTADGWVAEYDAETGKTTLTKAYEANVTNDPVKVIDVIGNEAIIQITITCIDKEAPVLKAGSNIIETGAIFNTDQTVKVEDADFEKATLYINGEKQTIASLDTDLAGSGYTTTTAANKVNVYTWVLEDELGNANTLAYTIDKVAPVVTGVEDAKTYATATPKCDDEDFDTVTLTKDGDEVEDYTLGTTLSEGGVYVLTVTDKAGNATVINFTIDKDLPNVTGVSDKAIYNTTVTPVTTDTDIKTIVLTNNGEEVKDYTLGDDIEDEGNYVLTVTDNVGNTTVISFQIDTTAPVVNGVKVNDELKVATPTTTDTDVKEVALTKDGDDVENYTLGTTLSEEGSYVLTVTDKAGNVNTINFIIDTTKPEIAIAEDATVVEGVEKYQEANITITEANTYTVELKNKGIMVPGYPKTGATTVTLNTSGEYVLTVTDKAGNSVEKAIIIDADGPQVHGKIQYSTLQPTNQTIRITVVLDEKVETITSGDSIVWTKPTEGNVDGKTIYADVNDNQVHTVTVTDALGNSNTITVQATNYDDVAPTAPTYTKEVVEGGTKVVATFAEDVQLPTGWAYEKTDNKKIISKVFTASETTFEMDILDLAGNKLAIAETTVASLPNKV